MTAQTQTLQAAAPRAQQDDLVGTWDLLSCFMENVETKERKEVWGEKPNGRLMMTATGDWIVVQTAQGRMAPLSDEDRSAAFRSMLAYSGKYRVEGEKIVIKVDIAWDEAWTGTEQVRFFKCNGDRLHIEVAPQRYPNLGDNVMRAVLIWQRAE
jgi:Lipocalin-like domain